MRGETLSPKVCVVSAGSYRADTGSNKPARPESEHKMEGHRKEGK